MTERPESEAPASGPPLAREFTSFLLELAVGVHRFAVYPPGHPSLEPAAEAVTELLVQLLRERPVLRIGVGRRQLFLEGGATEARHPLLGDLAHRLHVRQIAALSFAPGVRLHEVEELLAALGREPQRDEVPLGLRAPEELPSWPHARIHPLGVDRMVITDGAGWSGARALDLWMGLAARVLGGDAVDPERASDPVAVARAIDAAVSAGAGPARLCDQLAQLVAELRATSGAEAEEVRTNVARLVSELDPETLERIVAMDGDADRRRAFLHDANHGLPLEAVRQLVDAAARARGLTLSGPLAGLLDKLSAHAGETVSASGSPADEDRSRRRASAGSDLRQILDRLFDELEGSPGAERTSSTLDVIAHAAPVFRARGEGEKGRAPDPPGPLRVVHTALEAGATGATVDRALVDLIDRGEATATVELLRDAAASNDTAGALLDRLTTPESLRRLMARPEVEVGALRVLVERAGERAVDPLLDVLMESESRSLRRQIFDTLIGLGPAVGEGAVRRLEDPRWFVQRNMLALLQQLDGLPRGFDPLWFTSHADHRVRREAFPLALRDPVSRDRAVALALADRDERLVRMALIELRGGLPDGLLPTIVRRAMGEDRSDEIRALAVRTVSDSDQRIVRDALLALAAPGRSLFGRPRVGAPSSALVAALEALASRWSADPQVGDVLERARRSSDPAVVRAAGGQP